LEHGGGSECRGYEVDGRHCEEGEVAREDLADELLEIADEQSTVTLPSVEQSIRLMSTYLEPYLGSAR